MYALHMLASGVGFIPSVLQLSPFSTVDLMPRAMSALTHLQQPMTRMSVHGGEDEGKLRCRQT
jgi:hypothetical protein